MVLPFSEQQVNQAENLLGRVWDSADYFSEKELGRAHTYKHEYFSIFLPIILWYDKFYKFY
ncbi:hypothetical protein PATA110616_04345 [Paenibacillus tarimensis]